MASHGLTGRHRNINRAPYTNGRSNGYTNGYTNGHTNGDSVKDDSHSQRKVFILSAFHQAMGEQQIARLESFLESRIQHAKADFIEDLSYTLAECRTLHTWRRAISAHSAEELLESLRAESVKFSKSKTAVRLGFVFTGQGAQWYAMGRELMDQYPTFLESLHSSERFLTAMGANWSLIGTPTPANQCIVSANAKKQKSSRKTNNHRNLGLRISLSQHVRQFKLLSLISWTPGALGHPV